MKRTFLAVAVVLGLSVIGLRAQMQHVDLKDAKGNSVGMAMISAGKSGGISIALDVKVLPPGDHAIHLHANGVCEPPFTSAGGHFNPGNKKHGMQNPDGHHAGDMMNFTVAKDGTSKTTVNNADVTMQTVGGLALVIHATADDMKTDPSGNAGDRSPAESSRNRCPRQTGAVEFRANSSHHRACRSRSSWWSAHRSSRFRLGHGGIAAPTLRPGAWPPELAADVHSPEVPRRSRS
jgi:Cu-Zn family superoxide dismutase